MGFGGAEGIPGHEQPPGHGLGQQPQCSLCASQAGHQPQLHLGQAEPGRLTDSPQVTCHGELAASAVGDPLDSSHHGLRESGNGLHRPAQVGDEGVKGVGGFERAELGDVGAGTEGAFARSGDDHGTDRRVRGQPLGLLHQPVCDGGVERVENVGAVKGDHLDAVVSFGEYNRFGHAGLPAMSLGCCRRGS